MAPPSLMFNSQLPFVPPHGLARCRRPSLVQAFGVGTARPRGGVEVDVAAAIAHVSRYWCDSRYGGGAGASRAGVQRFV